jgi:hypothetical protein
MSLNTACRVDRCCQPTSGGHNMNAEKGAHSSLLFPLMNLGRNYAAQRRGKKETPHAQAPPLKIVRNVRTLPKHLQGRAAHKDPEKKAGTYEKPVHKLLCLSQKYDTFW